MPVYLCTAGTDQTEPWKHGIQVFPQPFEITGSLEHDSYNHSSAVVERSVGTHELIPTDTDQTPPIRKVMHAQVVLVDDVCIAYERYWVRLRWPGSKGGFAGYIAMGKVSEGNNDFGTGRNATSSSSQNNDNNRDTPTAEDQEEEEREEQPSKLLSEISAPADDDCSEQSNIVELICKRTNLSFPSSGVFQLLTVYDDGVRSTLPPYPTEQVFCRICREGLHDDAEELPAAATEEGGGFAADRANSMEYQSEDGMDPSEPTSNDQGPVRPHPVYSPHTEFMENPMLAPCQCSGSMAFVHYMCIEQWRCRSRHPTAENGLNCETCGIKYALPAPTGVQHVDEPGEWQDAMPAHVMNALRQPHIWWQLGAAIVRRRWLRPAAPIIMSPIVALYCRARRLLKKRGVARRRWACSLCRRRARWKCVRCLRSYYCSRQCQNVSWHIIHKHVCYKPSRMYGSIIFYGIVALGLMPGILRDPLFYDIGVLLVPVSFVVVSVIAGGLATLMKKMVGVDTRGRRLEVAVVLSTAFMSIVSMGLLGGFFGNPTACRGMAGRYSVTEEDLSSTYFLRLLHGLFRPYERLYKAIDSTAARVPKWTRLCVHDDGRCFTHLGNANASFYLGNEQCAADLLLVGFLYLAAIMTYVANGIHKHRERQQRRRRHFHAD